MSPYMILFIAGAAAIGPVVLYLTLARDPKGSAAFAAAMAGAFAGFTAVTIWADGVMLVIENHSTNLLGVQVWYDLLISVSIALLFVVPRARSGDECALVGAGGCADRQFRPAGHGCAAFLARIEDHRSGGCC